MALHNADTSTAWFDAENDQFVFNFEDGEEYYRAVKEDGKKLYPIGSGNWIWEEKTAA